MDGGKLKCNYMYSLEKMAYKLHHRQSIMAFSLSSERKA